jgi:hypothetical protein
MLNVRHKQQRRPHGQALQTQPQNQTAFENERR